jgi:SAM-dependent methyltransferase
MDPDLELLTEGDLYDRVWVRAPEVEWFARCLDPEAGAVLEAGCGTGRVAMPMARAGFTVIGQDLSEERLRLFQSKAGSMTPEERDRISIRLGDMVDEFPPDPFAALLLPFNMTAEFDAPRLFRLLEKTRDALPDGGRLISVQLLPKPIQLELGQSEFTCEGRAWPDGTRLLFHSSTLHMPPVDGTGERESRYWLTYKAIRGNVVVREWVFSGVLWHRPPEVFRDMLANAGFKTLEHWGDSLGREPYAPGAGVSAILAEKV